ncbi:MAG: DUF2911 domain-containing protein [Chitinophagaceae bacterium]|nr:MAG: DUF2911 domain-containing protein [Chitinophagaceae bacterium]
MKYALLLVLAATTLFTASAQDKKPVASPPMTAKETISSGATVTINYSAPSVKGRTIGKDLEPKDGAVWRTGANKATTFEVSQDVTVEGQALPKGKYSLFTLVNGDEWTIIFNKTADQWGAFDYKDADDALRVKVKGMKGAFMEKLTFTIAKDGKVAMHWGDHKVDFTVK